MNNGMLRTREGSRFGLENRSVVGVLGATARVAFPVSFRGVRASVETEGVSSESSSEIRGAKRLLDLALILLALPVAAPLMAIIALGIKLVSKGPILFRQERVGHRGQRFTCFKFRSMHHGASASTHEEHVKKLMENDQPMNKLDGNGDKRLIPCGALLRSTGLDELPQLINVLKGEMSLIGPRPCTTYEWDVYKPWQRERFNALPGLTGLWQVSGKNKTTFNEMVDLDIEYVRKQSLGLDLWIVFMTFPTLWNQLREAMARKAAARVRTPVAASCPQLPQVGVGSN